MACVNITLNTQQEELCRTAIGRLMKFPLSYRVRTWKLRDNEKGKPATSLNDNVLEINTDEPLFLNALCSELLNMEHIDAHSLVYTIESET